MVVPNIMNIIKLFFWFVKFNFKKVKNYFLSLRRKKSGDDNNQENRLNEKSSKFNNILSKIPLLLLIGWLIGITVLNAKYKPIAIVDRETGGSLYCSKNCIQMIFIQMIAVWSILCLMMLIIILLLVIGSIQFKKAKKNEKIEETISI